MRGKEKVKIWSFFVSKNQSLKEYTELWKKKINMKNVYYVWSKVYWAAFIICLSHGNKQWAENEWMQEREMKKKRHPCTVWKDPESKQSEKKHELSEYKKRKKNKS